MAVAAESKFQCKSDGLQQEMNACAVRDYKAADANLNAAYKQALATMSPRKQEELRKEQGAWVRNRESRCRAEAEASEGGSIWSLEFFGCLKTVTEQRTMHLNSWRIIK